jgi:hypothetical protein
MVGAVLPDVAVDLQVVDEFLHAVAGQLELVT